MKEIEKCERKEGITQER